MARSRVKRYWSRTEEKMLIENYSNCTINELCQMLHRRTKSSINNKIKNLKKLGKIKDDRDDDTIKRAYLQRDFSNKD